MSRILFLLFALLGQALAQQSTHFRKPQTTWVPMSFAKPVSVGNFPLTISGGSTVGISGIARPTLAANAGKMWIMNDNVGTVAIIAQDPTNAATSYGVWTLGTGPVTRTDFEDLSSANVNGTSYIYVADFGNNGNAADSRGTSPSKDMRIYRCIEPTITGSNSTIADANIETILCAFPSTPTHRDCEALLVDKVSGDMYMITKRIYPAACYRLKHQASYSGVQTLEYMGKVATDTSATSLAIGTGSKAFTVDRGLPFAIGMLVRAQSRANQANWMEGRVTARTPTTLTIYVEVNTPTLADPALGGSGTLADWDISLPKSYTPTANDGNVTGGCIAPNNEAILLCSYAQLFVFPRARNGDIYTALSGAPSVQPRPPGSLWYRHDTLDVPGFPQGECLDFVDATGDTLFEMTEWIAANARGTTCPVVTSARVRQNVTTLRLTSTADNFIGSSAPGTSSGTAVSLVADTDPGPFVTTAFSSTTNSSGQTIFAVTSATNFAVGRTARVTVGTGYIGTWEVTGVSGTNITLDVPFATNVSGTIAGTTQVRQGLIKFDVSSIPAGSTIMSAVVRLFINTEGESVALHRMKVTWDESSTYTSLGAICPDKNVKAVTTPDHLTIQGLGAASIAPGYIGFMDFPVPNATVQGWVDGTFSNFGWLVIQNQNDVGGNGFQFDSNNSATASRFPMLILSYK